MESIHKHLQKAAAAAKTEQATRREAYKNGFSGSQCTFCGAPVRPGQSVCDECGMPQEGVVCPLCGTLNHRPFCSRCNTPLNRAAQAAIAKAEKDPSFSKVKELVKKAVELKEKMTGEGSGPSEGTLEFLKLFSADIAFIQSSDKQLQQEYQETVRDIEQLFAQMLPPAGSTPQQQFNYYSARNIAVTTVVQDEVRIKSPVEWVCNYCGCHHSRPSDCEKPFLGGKWIYQDKVVQEKVIKKEIRTEE